MDPLTISACVAALAGVGGGWRWHRRACRAEVEVAQLRSELQAAHHAACHDPLTGLPNRRAFYQMGTALLTDPAKHPLFVVVLDLDDFKLINDSFGHAVGDEVLVTVARRFQSCAGPSLVARLGGDEFAGLFTGPTRDCDRPPPAADRLAEAFATPMQVADRCMLVTASIGLAPVTGCTHLAEAVRRADAAMYHAKHRRTHATCSTSAIEDQRLQVTGPPPAPDRSLTYSTDPRWVLRHSNGRRPTAVAGLPGTRAEAGG